MSLTEIPAHVDEMKIDAERIRACLDRLPEEYRVVVLMFYFEELSYREIAEALGVAMGTVMSRLSRAKGRLRQSLLSESPLSTDQE